MDEEVEDESGVLSVGCTDVTSLQDTNLLKDSCSAHFRHLDSSTAGESSDVGINIDKFAAEANVPALRSIYFELVFTSVG